MEVKLAELRTETIQRLLQGSIDMHIHFGPEPNAECRQDALELALKAEEYGMRAIVLKHHFYPTAPVAYIVQKSAPSVSVFGGLCLEVHTGGLNPPVVEASARLGAKVVWMPVLSAANSQRLLERLVGYVTKGGGISILDPEGRLVPEVTDILEIARDYDMVVATGHISPREIFALVNEAQRVGLSKIVVTHALSTAIYEEALTIEEHQQLAEKGVFIEHCFWQLLPTGGSFDPGMVQAIRKAGAEHCIMSTDFGRNYLPPAPEGMRMFIATMLKFGLSEDEIGYMAKTNPARLLGLT